MTDLIEVDETEYQECALCDDSINIESMFTCVQCNKDTCSSCTSSTVNGDNICDSCRDDHYSSCDKCGEIDELDNLHWINEETYCDSCRDHHCSMCSDCNKWFNDDEMTDGHCSICSEHYSCCASCDSFTHLDSLSSCNCGDLYCNDCYDDHRSDCEDCHGEIADLDSHSQSLKTYGASAVTDYHPSIDWDFLNDKTDNDTDPFFGIELEIESGSPSNSLNEAAKLIGDKLTGKCICSHDGSLNNGFEIVFTPHKTKAFKKLNMNDVLKGIMKTGCTSFEKGTCGLHIHIQRTEFFRKRLQYRGNTLTNAQLFQGMFNLMQDDITRFSHRRASHISSYCNFRSTENISCDRYCAVNLSNRNTIEIRIWRGTLKPSRFRANILFSLAMVDFMKAVSKTLIVRCIDKNKPEYLQRTFHDWLVQSREYQALVPYFTAKKLFNF